MGDAAIQGYLQGLLQATTTFDAADVTLGDFRVLDRGGTGSKAVILPGRIVSGARSGDWSQVQLVWEHTIELFERFIDDSYSDFVSARQVAVDVIGGNPTLGGHSEITGAHVGSATEPLYLYAEGGREVPQFVFSRVVVRSVEEVLYAGTGEFV